MPRPARQPASEAEVEMLPERSPARQKLADAIATVAALEAEIADSSAAVTKAEDDRRDAAAALRDAERALERAKPRPVDSFARDRAPYTFRSQEEADAHHALMNTPPPSIEDARAAVAKATDARDTAVTAEQFHRRRLEQATGRLSWKRSDIDDALRLAVHFDPALKALAVEAKSLATRAAAAARAFETATGGATIHPGNPFYGCTNPSDFRIDPEGWRMLHVWREALDRLRSDLDAALPMPASP